MVFDPGLWHYWTVHLFESAASRRRRGGAWRQVVFLISAAAGLVLAAAAHAQSTRPGWGATPYQDALGTGVTFRVWAPNATSVYLP